MNLESLRALKLELQEDPVLPHAIARALGVSAARAPRALAERLDRAHTRSARETNVAIGVAKGRGPKDYRLGVRVQLPARKARAFASHVEARARGEVDVRIVPRVKARPLPQRRWFRSLRRPLEPGLSIGQGPDGAGTLGAFVEDADGLYVLSNNHVLADVNAALPGAPVSQPGDLDRNATRKTLIGVLDRFIPISFTRANVVDCAIAEVLHGVKIRRRYHRVLRGRKLRAPRPITLDDLGRRVFKAGRTTGVTFGRITQVEVDRLRVELGDDDDLREALFSDQIEVEGDDGRAFSDSGDSGSLIVDRTGTPLALLFCGGPDERGADLTWANVLTTVLAKLGVQFAR